MLRGIFVCWTGSRAHTQVRPYGIGGQMPVGRGLAPAVISVQFQSGRAASRPSTSAWAVWKQVTKRTTVWVSS